jgi:acetyl esterase/lipase
MRHFFHVVLFALLAGAGLTGCRPVDVLNGVTPSAGYRLHRDIAYGALPRQGLDVYSPTAPIANPAPVIVFIYGGSWSSGGKADYRFVGQQLAAQGYTVVIADYRLYPEVKYPTFLEDGGLALKWVQDSVAAYGGDPNRIFLMGHSAGAYNAAMLALDPRWTTQAGFDRSRLKGFVGLAGPYDFALDSDLLRGVFGAALYAETQPVTYAQAKVPPVLLLVGDADKTVNPENSASLARHLRASGNLANVRHYADDDHIDLVLELSSFWSANSAALADILHFLRDPSAQ